MHATSAYSRNVNVEMLLGLIWTAPLPIKSLSLMIDYVYNYSLRFTFGIRYELDDRRDM